MLIFILLIFQIKNKDFNLYFNPNCESLIYFIINFLLFLAYLNLSLPRFVNTRFSIFNFQEYFIILKILQVQSYYY